MSIHESNTDIKNLLRSLQGKPVFILTKFGMRYKTNNLQVGEEIIKFTDKWGVEVALAIDQIAQITEVSDGSH